MIRFGEGQRIEFPSGTTFFGTDTPDPWKLIQGSTIFSPCRPCPACLRLPILCQAGSPTAITGAAASWRSFLPSKYRGFLALSIQFQSEAKCITRVSSPNHSSRRQEITSPCEKEDPVAYQSPKQQPHGLDLT